MVALANYVRLRDPRAAEVAFAVADDSPGPRHRHAPARAAGRARRRARASSPSSSRSCLSNTRTARDRSATPASSSTRERSTAGPIEVTIPDRRRPAHDRDRVDEREPRRRAGVAQPFLEPKCVAVYGASARRGSIGGELFRNILTADFAGAAYPVNRSGDAGRRRARLRERRRDPGAGRPRRDLPAGRAVIAAAQEALEAGVSALCRHLGRLRRDRPRGRHPPGAAARARARPRRAADRAELPRHGIRPSSRLNATFAPRAFRAREASASRRRAARSVSRCSSRRGSASLGLSSLRRRSATRRTSRRTTSSSTGRTTRTTKLVMLYLECFGNPRASHASRAAWRARSRCSRSRAARRAAGARPRASHTAALAGSDAAVDALFRQTGVHPARRRSTSSSTSRPCSTTAGAARPPGRGAHERRRPRDPLRRRVRGRGPRAARRRATETRGR